MVISASSSSLGRRVRLAVVGGGGNALIGPVHRIAARLDDRFEICAGVLSSDPARSIADATALHIPRGYADMATMIAEEARRSDPIDAVAIMTPNDSHHRYAAMALDAGLDVICDKPITNDFDEALDLVERARSRRLVFCLTHNYSGYPMVREARATIEAGEIGPLRVLHVSYVQGSLGTRVEDQPDAMSSRLKWRLDPAKGGLSHVLGDIGTHAHQLLTYTSGSVLNRFWPMSAPPCPGEPPMTRLPSFSGLKAVPVA
jgi:predicted dehydrogenase